MIMKTVLVRYLYVTGLTVILLMMMSSGAFALDFTGYARTYTGLLLHEENDYAVIQNTFDLKIEHSRSRVAMKINPYLYHNAETDRDVNDELELGLRQAYMDIYFDAFDLRLGKQQIIWGKADGVFITDVISPKDLREFLLPDFEEIRIGVTAAKLNYYRGDQTFELAWVPVFTPNQKPEQGSIWLRSPDFAITPVMDDSREDVPARLENSELFAKYSLLGSAIDLELMAGYAWDDDPTLHLTKTFDPESGQVTSLTLRPEHHRLALMGGSFSTTLGGFVLRGEGAYYSGKYFQSADPRLSESVQEKDYLHYLLGAEYTLRGVKLSAQFIQQAIIDYEDQIVNDQFENTLTLLAGKDFLRDTLHLELFAYLGLNDQDALLRPKIKYDLADGFQIQAGANIFVGEKGNFGQYDDNDMLYAKVTYSF
jgi:hypothetical protein